MNKIGSILGVKKKYLGNAKGGYSNIRSKSPEEQGKEVQEVLSVESNGG